MKHSFRLTKFNYIFGGIAAILFAIYKIRVQGTDPMTLGEIIGFSISLFLIPGVFALLVWLIRGRKRNAGTTTFNIILGLSLFGQCSEFTKQSAATRTATNQITNARSDLKESLITNPNNTDADYDRFNNTITDGVDKLITNSVGSDRQAYIGLKNFRKEVDIVTQNWKDQYGKIQDSTTLNFSLLQKKQECTRQEGLINKYIEASKDYKKLFLSQEQIIEKHLGNLHKNNNVAKGIRKGVIDKASRQEHVLVPFINSHIEYGENLLSIVNILKQENEKWNYINDQLLFENDQATEDIDSIFNQTLELEGRIEKLRLKLIEVL